jgi:hypothetical protein
MLVFFTVSYLLATTQEWLFHRYMHIANASQIQKNHQKHHASKEFSDDICFDIRNGTDFFQLFLFFMGNNTALGLLFYPSVSLVCISTTSAFLLTFNIFVWNTYHPFIHGLDGFALCFLKGIPRENVPTLNLYSSWVIENHLNHHLHPNGNFNIVFPGADYLFGTRIRSKQVFIK